MEPVDMEMEVSINDEAELATKMEEMVIRLEEIRKISHKKVGHV